MKVTLDLPDIKETIEQAVETALKNKQAELSDWPYYTGDETAKLLQIKKSTLQDKRMPYLNEIEYSQQGERIRWFKKESVLKFIQDRLIRKYRGRIPITKL